MGIRENVCLIVEIQCVHNICCNELRYFISDTSCTYISSTVVQEI